MNIPAKACVTVGALDATPWMLFYSWDPNKKTSLKTAAGSYTHKSLFPIKKGVCFNVFCDKSFPSPHLLCVLNYKHTGCGKGTFNIQSLFADNEAALQESGLLSLGKACAKEPPTRGAGSQKTLPIQPLYLA